MRVSKSPALLGRCRLPGDKSISHRALLLGGIALGKSHLQNFPSSGDCRATEEVLRALGVQVEAPSPTLRIVHGRGLYGLRAPAADLDCQNSGTTMRLCAGLLAGQPFASRLTGNPQLRARPMERVIRPLQQLGALISGYDQDRFAPLALAGAASGQLHGGAYQMPMASAQVKSALLLCGLYASEPVTVSEPGPARDHTERMLATMGAKVHRHGSAICIEPLRGQLSPLDLCIPGDISSAAFVIVAATLIPGSQVILEGVGVNPTRTGLLEALQTMGADIRCQNRRDIDGEPVADLEVRHSVLQARRFGGAGIVTLVDELPLLALAATQAAGCTQIGDAAELRVKETDRIRTTASELARYGAHIHQAPDGFHITGPTPLHGAMVSSHGDHRLAMVLAVAGLLASGTTAIADSAVHSDSFPQFVSTLQSLGARLDESSE